MPSFYQLLLQANILIFSPKCLVGYDKESDELNADTLRKYLFGGHVRDYMRSLQEENEEKYKTHFSRYIKAGVTPDNVSCRLQQLNHVILCV